MSPPTSRHDGRARAAGPFLLPALFVVACGPASGGDPEFWAPRSESGGGGGSSGLPGAAGSDAVVNGGGDGGSTGSGGEPSRSGRVTFQFTTVSFDGRYAPKNVGAVWIADGQDRFVKTLELWGSKRAKHLVRWREASANNVVDAVSGATQRSHDAHESSWDGTDVAGQVVPDGAYRVYVEFTEMNSANSGVPAGPWMAVGFVKGPAPEELVLPDQPAFRSNHLAYSP